VFAFVTGSFADPAKAIQVGAQGPDVGPSDTVRRPVEVLVAQPGEARQYRIDLDLAGDEGSKGIAVV
jgi:hypothetical protein